MNKLQNGKITALYERLSNDDERKTESLSIAHQKQMLESYAQRNGFHNIRHFFDDGITGTSFNRPGLNAMLEEIKAGNVATVIIKDQSRIGRDVVEVGLLKRTFDEYNVRFIAAEDGLDTAKGFDIMSLMRDVFNEFYECVQQGTTKFIITISLQAPTPTYPPHPHQNSHTKQSLYRSHHEQGFYQSAD